MPIQRLATVPLIALLLAGCQTELSRETATEAIEASKLIRPTDKVTVEGISSTSNTEAVVRATIAGNTANLKLRRFDTGWTWEFVETKAGGWVAPDVAIGQIREEQRGIAAAAWAEQHKAAYTKTAKTMWYVTVYHVPNPTERENYEIYVNSRKSLASFFKEPEHKERVAVITSERWTDAWGSDIQLQVSDKDSSILISSAGPDKTIGTEDDLLCLNTFRRGYEDGRQVWNRARQWRVPEGLAISIEDFDQEDDKLEYSRVVKP